MTILTMVWALKRAPVPANDPVAHLVLIAYADHANDDGTAAWPSVATVASYARCTPRTVHTKLRVLLEHGLMRPGDQQLVDHLPANRRPVVYDLVMDSTPEPVGAATDLDPGEAAGQAGVKFLHPRTGALEVVAVDNSRSGVNPASPQSSESVDNRPAGVKPVSPHPVDKPDSGVKRVSPQEQVWGERERTSGVKLYDPETRTAATVYGCSDDYKASGHQQWTDPDAPAATANVLSEDERAERRQVRENNAAWRSAETVRREWLPTLAARKTPPKCGAEFIVRAVAFDGALLQDAATKGHLLAAQMLGHKQSIGGARYIAGLLDKASTPRSQVIALVVVLAAIEQDTGVHTWRHARPEDTAARYLTTLEGWGYGLSDIEKQTCGRTTTATDAA